MHEYELSSELESQVYFGQLLGMCDYITFPLGNTCYDVHVLLAYEIRK